MVGYPSSGCGTINPSYNYNVVGYYKCMEQFKNQAGRLLEPKREYACHAYKSNT